MNIKLNFNKKSSKIDLGVKQAREEDGSYLIDVRSSKEYKEGHIKGSINLPLEDIEDIDVIVDDPESKIYLYCRSGKRSSQGATILRSLGYENVINIGGILDWSGEMKL